MLKLILGKKYKTSPRSENRSGGMTHTQNTHNLNILTEHIVSRWEILYPCLPKAEPYLKYESRSNPLEYEDVIWYTIFITMNQHEFKKNKTMRDMCTVPFNSAQMPNNACLN